MHASPSSPELARPREPAGKRGDGPRNDDESACDVEPFDRIEDSGLAFESDEAESLVFAGDAQIVVEPRPIPSTLHSAFLERPFTHCTICSRALRSPSPPGSEGPPESEGPLLYEIQKVFRGTEVLFEMAICRHCSDAISREFSEESLNAMKGFLLANFRPSGDAATCHFCRVPVDLPGRWTVVGACHSDRLLFPEFVACEPCTESLQLQLSQKTRDTQDEFIRDHFPGVPADMDVSPRVFGI